MASKWLSRLLHSLGAGTISMCDQSYSDSAGCELGVLGYLPLSEFEISWGVRTHLENSIKWMKHANCTTQWLWNCAATTLEPHRCSSGENLCHRQPFSWLLPLWILADPCLVLCLLPGLPGPMFSCSYREVVAALTDVTVSRSVCRVRCGRPAAWHGRRHLAA